MKIFCDSAKIIRVYTFFNAKYILYSLYMYIVSVQDWQMFRRTVLNIPITDTPHPLPGTGFEGSIIYVRISLSSSGFHFPVACHFHSHFKRISGRLEWYSEDET